ncbi:A24 family peptidase [Agromyces sp. S2-1-8]|uniref:prepilin peptidase n=1 Tax=Agromyces sp. S2-1-8 TaxID=2897180 RepID=UPI001E56D1C4|nr:A24 family peptidase [Agromyces sp. S2-1-8]MCD5344956.1 A24 family peptidase [Agromyces sp. S2-1-8]
MPLLETSLSVVLAVVGFVLGWWPLAAWAEHSMKHGRMPRRTIRVASAVTAAVTFGLLALRVGLEWLLPALVAFAAFATVLAIVDLAEKRLPNAVVFPALAVVGVLLVPATWATGEWMRLVWALAGAAAMFAAYFVLALISPSAMGMGDVKLALVIGLVAGWFGLSAWFVALLAAFVIGGVISLIALALKRVTLRGSIPFGPSMLAGALVAVWLAAG